jgi:hypothetical protein
MTLATAFIDRAGDIAQDLLQLPADHFRTALADPPWQFENRTGKVAPEHQRLRRYRTMTLGSSHGCVWAMRRSASSPINKNSCGSTSIPQIAKTEGFK